MSGLNGLWYCCGGSDIADVDEKYPRIKALGLGHDVNLDEAIEPLPFASKALGFPTYSTEPDQPLRGVPIREGTLWQLSAPDRFEPVGFSLYVNGFALTKPDGSEVSLSLTPFSLVRTCRFESGACAQLKSFKVSLLDREPCFYFAVRDFSERDADDERSEWVLGISHSILLIIDSLLPRVPVSCDPLPLVSSTQRRLMAGYLIYRDDHRAVSVLFCELHSNCGESARIVFYENEQCTNPITDLVITNASECCDVVGINCSCFNVDQHYFSAQSPSEKKLWLRAVSNVKVKLLNSAPTPNLEDLCHYREAIRDHILSVEAVLEPRISSDALLTLLPTRRLRKPWCVEGDRDSRDTAPDDLPGTPRRIIRPVFSL